VIAGRAKVLDEHGRDLTAKMVEGAQAMLAFARQAHVELAMLTDMRAACGSQVISDGCRLVTDRRWQKGVGVATAVLLDAGISSLGPARLPNPGASARTARSWLHAVC